MKFLTPRHLLSAPFILGLFDPLIMADILVEIYHRICFPLYRLEYVKRSQYIKIDRQKLNKLRLFEKLFCMYCGYVNGWLAFTTEIAKRTEKYWCGIKHAQDKNYSSPDYQKKFADRKKYE